MDKVEIQGTGSLRHLGDGTPRSWKKDPTTAAIIDSQIVRVASQPGVRGKDAGQNNTGRKRYVLEDTLGNILAF